MPEIQGNIMSHNRNYTAIYDVCCRFLSGKKIDDFSEDFLEMLLEMRIVKLCFSKKGLFSR